MLLVTLYHHGKSSPVWLFSSKPLLGQTDRRDRGRDPHDQGSFGFIEFDSSECPAWVARFRPTLRRRESSALGRKVSSGEVPWVNERWASRRLRRGPANGRLPSGNVPPTLRRRHPPCTLTRSPSSARPPRGASVCNGTGSNYGAAIYPYRYRYTERPGELTNRIAHKYM